ncbi:MAG TPA: glycosyltransferase family 1 protein [Rhodoblastus sp.]|nr:glycosyltransferase family 1 protein [Rhodoblastus sp.]
MRVLVVTDAWKPQVNGVVHSLEAVAREASKLGSDIRFCTPEGFRTIAMPGYREIRLALAAPRAVAARIEAAEADHVHIATEGPLGLLARHFCLSRKTPFTTSYHTRFPEYLFARTRLPLRWTYAALKTFHNAGAGVMTSTPRLAAELQAQGFRRTMIWSRGVDHEMFRPRPSVLDLPRPIFLYAGRVAIEKNIEAFLALDLPGSKVVVGDGPARAALQAAFPAAHFLGMRTGEALAQIYASADVFVFPSRTDTFGIVLLEAMASGLPVAAFPAPGPLDVVTSETGALSDDLRAACIAALDLSPEAARAHALTFTWENSARQFLENLGIARSAWRSAEQRELFHEGEVVQAR